MNMITDPTRTERETAADTTPTPAPTACPACQAPEYKDPLDKLFVRGDGAEWKLYECGARLVFHDVPPVRTEVTSPCTRAYAAAVALRAEREKLTAQLNAESVISNGYRDEIATLTAQLAEARAERDAANKHVDILNESNRSAFSEVERLRAELQERTGHASRMAKQVNTLTAQLAEARVGELEMTILAVNRNNDQLTIELVAAKERNERMAEDLVFSRELLRDAQIEIDIEDPVSNGISVLVSCDKELQLANDAMHSANATLTASLARVENGLRTLLKSRDCLTLDGYAEIPEELSAQFDIGLDDARQVGAALAAPVDVPALLPADVFAKLDAFRDEWWKFMDEDTGYSNAEAGEELCTDILPRLSDFINTLAPDGPVDDLAERNRGEREKE